MATFDYGAAVALFILARDTAPDSTPEEGLTLTELNERAEHLTDVERKQVDRLWLRLLERANA